MKCNAVHSTVMVAIETKIAILRKVLDRLMTYLMRGLIFIVNLKGFRVI